MKFLLCTDLDGTVLGDAQGELAFSRWVEARRGDLVLAYITGRSLDEVRALIGEGRLPEADFAAADVGTSVCDLRDPRNRLGRHYQELADPAWPAGRFREACHAEDTPLQGPQAQGRFKASFFWDGREASLSLFKGRSRDQGPHRLIITAGMYLDVLPPCFSKGQAVRFIMAAAGMDKARTVVAGDMEHDADMYEAAGKGIVPANALPAMKNMVEPLRPYWASTPMAWGLLEGFKALGLDA